MKKFIMAFAIIVAPISTLQAAESKEYCDQKCSPEHCKKYHLRAASCKTDCPDYWQKCYEAVPADAKANVDTLVQTHEKVDERKKSQSSQPAQ